MNTRVELELKLVTWVHIIDSYVFLVLIDEYQIFLEDNPKCLPQYRPCVLDNFPCLLELDSWRLYVIGLKLLYLNR